MRRRKVDKSEFVGQNAELFFGNSDSTLEKTFEHREQVYG